MLSHRDTCFLSASAGTSPGHVVAFFRYLGEGRLELETESLVHFLLRKGKTVSGLM